MCKSRQIRSLAGMIAVSLFTMVCGQALPAITEVAPPSPTPVAPATEVAPPPPTAAPATAATGPTLAPTVTTSPAPEPTTTDAPPPELLTSDIVPVQGAGVPPPGAGDSAGPWATRIMLAVSDDGLVFTRTGEIVADQGGVPNVIFDHDGRVRVYYVAWQGYGRTGGNDGDFIAVAIQDDAGGWVYRRVVIENPPPAPPGAGFVDPTVVLLPDGRYRLYYMADIGNFTLRIFSATSEDGVTFVQDAGERLAPDEPVFDPMVLQTGNNWLLWAGPDGSYTATSADGLDFAPAGPFEVGGRRFMTWSAIALPGNGYRLYGNFVGPGGGELTSVFSVDGLNWQPEPGARLTNAGADPAREAGIAPDNGAALSPDGVFLMAYLTLIP
ncbi:MAG: hypothetical protein ACE5FI_03215 [Anaerolineales bacterium]